MCAFSTGKAAIIKLPCGQATELEAKHEAHAVELLIPVEAVLRIYVRRIGPLLCTGPILAPLSTLRAERPWHRGTVAFADVTSLRVHGLDSRV